jgi:hypothetical protein
MQHTGKPSIVDEGANGFFRKPIDGQALVKLINTTTQVKVAFVATTATSFCLITNLE